MALRLIILGVLGGLLGCQLNRAIYRWAWNKRLISPWSKAPDNAPARRWYDRIPIAGWWFLRREAAIHGRAFWIRPLLIEISTTIGTPVLYWWEISGRLLPLEADPTLVMGDIHAQFVSHMILFSLMLVATFIDLDEKTIPDEITIPGTLIALLLAALLPISLLPIAADTVIGPGAVPRPLLLTSPLPWAAELDTLWGLFIGWVCFSGWCYGLLPKTWWTRGGWRKAVRLLAASIVRHRFSLVIGAVWVVGSLAIAPVWLISGASWRGLLTSLVGIAFGGGLVWAVRVVASGMLGQEAMGFGDVTLMAMIGAFLGWQPSLMVFFMAPFAGLLIAVTQWIITRRKDIAYGPFLCVAAFVLVICWRPIWERWGPIFQLGLFIPAVVAVCVLLMAMMLGGYRLLLRLFGVGR